MAENQADCVSGAFLRYLATLGFMTEGDDEIDIARTLIDIASAESDDRDHGTVDQRMRAFYAGYNSTAGLYACNYLSTNVVLINPPAS